MGKAEIKKDVFRTQFGGAIRLVERSGDMSATDLVPRAEPDDMEQTLDNVTCVVEDTGIRFHGFDNMRSQLVKPDALTGEGGGYKRYTKIVADGETLVRRVLAPVQRAFDEHRRITVAVLCMDKKGLMPAPKYHTQKARTHNLLAQMERQSIAPIEWKSGEPIPLMVSRDKQLPPWIAVRANRTLYRHAVSQVFDLLLETYTPPPGCRLIIDAMDMSAVYPENLDDWMRSERIYLDEFGTQIVNRAREALRADPEWRKRITRIVQDLGHAGHLWSVPLCLETTERGERLAPFCLPNARNQCGEADVGIEFWIDALQARKQHKTLEGKREFTRTIEEDLASKYYSSEQIEQDLSSRARNAPEQSVVPFSERIQRANKLVEEHPDVEVRMSARSKVPALTTYIRTSDKNPCKQPNRTLVLSRDTDFLSLVPLFYARMRQKYGRQYAIDNAPLISIGPCTSFKLGWVQDVKKDGEGNSDQTEEVFVPGGAAGKKRARDEPDKKQYCVSEIYDVHRLYECLMEKFGIEQTTSSSASTATAATSSSGAHGRASDQAMSLLLSFATFCASCENDFLAGLYFVNKRAMWQAFCNVNGQLAVQVHRTPVICPRLYVEYIKNCYHRSLMNARGKDKPPSASTISYNTLAEYVMKKYKKTPKKCMPDAETLQLMYERTQWWLVYASKAWQSIGVLLDHSTWGWRPGTLDLMV